MWQPDKRDRKWTAALCAGALLFQAFCAPVMVFGESAPADAARQDAEPRIPLCGENEYVGLRSGLYSWVGGTGAEDLVTLYDSEGNVAGSYMAAFYPPELFSLIPKDRLYIDRGGGLTSIYNTTGLQLLFSLPDDAYACDVQDDCVVTYEYSTGDLCLYDKTGNLLASESVRLPGGKSFEAEKVSASLLKGDTFYYIRITDGTNMFAALCRPALDDPWLCSDDPAFPSALLEQPAGTLGDYFVLTREGPEGGTTCSVCTPDGVCVLEDVQRGRMEYNNYNNIAKKAFQIQEVLKRTGETEWTVYDRDLQIMGTLPDSAVRAVGDTSYLIGMAYAELGGGICDGAVLLNGEPAPYTLSAEGAYVLSPDGDLLSFPLPEGSAPAAANDCWLLAKREDNSYLLLDRINGEILKTFSRPVTLQKDSLLIYRDYQDPDSEFEVYDEDLELVCHSSRFIRPCGPEAYYMERGPYIGIADRYGNWLLRVLPRAE